MGPRDLVFGSLTLSIPQPAGLHDAVRVFWRGKSDDVRPSRFLGPHFLELLQEAARRGGLLELHFEELSYVNSSTLAALAQLIRDARSMQVKLTLVYDGGSKWQSLAFDALRVFVTDDGAFQMRPIGRPS